MKENINHDENNSILKEESSFSSNESKDVSLAALSDINILVTTLTKDKIYNLLDFIITDKEKASEYINMIKRKRSESEGNMNLWIQKFLYAVYNDLIPIGIFEKNTSGKKIYEEYLNDIIINSLLSNKSAHNPGDEYSIQEFIVTMPVTRVVEDYEFPISKSELDYFNNILKVNETDSYTVLHPSDFIRTYTEDGYIKIAPIEKFSQLDYNNIHKKINTNKEFRKILKKIRSGTIHY